MTSRKQPKRKRSNPARKKKSAKQLIEAHARDQEYQAIGEITDRDERRVAELCFQRTYIARDLLEAESRCLQTRWIAYRYMTPLQATERFVDDYIAAYRRAWARHRSLHDAPMKQPCASSFAMNDRADMTSFWGARQRVDALGMPYDLFFDIVMDRWLSGRKTNNPPLPNQLCSGKLFEGWMRGHPTWEEMSARLYLSDWDPRFFAQPRTDDPVHAAALRLLHVDVLHAKDHAGRLAGYMGRNGPLTESQAADLFDSEMVQDAVALVSVPAVASVDPRAYVPACIGNRTDVVDAPCRTCEFTSNCSKLKRKATRALINRWGSGDPRADRRRQQDRDRQRERREKLRQKAA